MQVMGAPLAGDCESPGGEFNDFLQPVLTLADRIKTGRRKCAPVLVTAQPTAPTKPSQSKVSKKILERESEPANPQTVPIVNQNKRKAAQTAVSVSKKSKRISSDGDDPGHESVTTSYVPANNVPIRSQTTDVTRSHDRLSLRRSTRRSSAQSDSIPETADSGPEHIPSPDQPLPASLPCAVNASETKIAETRPAEISTARLSFEVPKDELEVPESVEEATQTTPTTPFSIKARPETTATDPQWPHSVLTSLLEHSQESSTISENVLAETETSVLPEKTAEILPVTASASTQTEPSEITPPMPVRNKSPSGASPKPPSPSVKLQLPTPEMSENNTNPQILPASNNSVATDCSVPLSVKLSPSNTAGRLVPVIPSKLVWPLTPEPDYHTDSEIYNTLALATPDLVEASTSPTSLNDLTHNKLSAIQSSKTVNAGLHLDTPTGVAKFHAENPVVIPDPRWPITSSFRDERVSSGSIKQSVQTLQTATPAQSSLKALEQGPKVLVLKFECPPLNPSPNDNKSSLSLLGRDVPIHRPLPLSPEDYRFVQSVRIYLNDRGSFDKEWNNGVGQARRIGYILQIAQPPSAAEVLKLDEEQAAAYLATNAFTTCPILTSGQQSLPLQTPDQFLNEFYDDQAKVYIQDPTIKPSPRQCAVRAVAIGEVKARFAKHTSGDHAWNCLELATHVEDGLRPAFLNSEDCRLLTKLKHPSNRDKASRYSYEPGWKEVEKWALLAQAGALTEPHQDSHGFSTYITVNHGIFGFGWLSNPTLEERKSWNRSPSSFVGGRWRYVVLRPGQTVYFPGGTIHFVFRLPEAGNTLAFGGHILRCSQIVNWVKILIDEKKNSSITNEELTVSAPAYLGRVEKFVTQALARGDTHRWGGTEACEEFLRLKQEFGKTKKGR